jgi:radical SAM superfamily enzyme
MHSLYLWVELGLQTVHQTTSDLINRAHDMQTYYEGVAKYLGHPFVQLRVQFPSSYYNLHLVIH